MAADWRALALEQAELISSRLRELLSSGQGYIRSEFGVELGLEPEIYPSWVILSTVTVGLLVLVVLSWAAVCGGLFGGKKRGAPLTGDGCEPLKAPAVTKAAKPDEQKKKNKKKPSEKKSQSNGRPVPEPRQEEAKGGETSRPSPEIRTEKVQAKKNKKKPKPEVKSAKTVSAAAGKEPDDGAWETKVSNREKRQQKRKDRGPDGSGSPGGVEAPPTYHLDPPTVPARLPVSAKKNREPLHPRTSVKGDAVILSVSSSRREEAVNGGGGWTDISMKMPSQISSSEGDKWPPMPKAPRHRNPLPNTEPPTWRQETEGSWSGVDGRMKTDLKPVSFSVLSLSPTAAEPLPLPSSDLQWEAPVDDQWSGFNGISAVDPSSDWNAPTELWGNYEEPPPPAETPAPPPQESAPQPGKVSDDDDREDPASGGAAKSKKKKKKKKKAEEEGAPAQGVPESAAPPQVASLPRAQDLPPAPTSTKPGTTPPSHKKPDQSAEPPKPSQKKKVRRET